MKKSRRSSDWKAYCSLGFFAFLAVLIAVPAQAQLLQGVLEGNVTDASNAAVVGAEVTITNEQTNNVRTTTTGAAGNYNFPTVNTGTFSLNVTSPGFQSYTQRGITISINNVTRVNVSLEVGAVTETITVEANAATLQTDRAEVRAEIAEKSLKELPVPLGRNYQMLFVQLPGFSPPQNGHSIPSNPSRSVQFSVNGTSRSNNNTRIDGASSTNIWLPHMTGYLPALESIETVNVVSNSFDAEQGLAGGAAINVQIKSGTNSFHGSAFEYHTNQHLKAYPYISNRNTAKGKLVDNQYGGTIGGPIKKDKVFFFVSYEGRRESEYAQKQLTVPTAALKSGDLSVISRSTVANAAVYDPLTGNPNGTGRTKFENNIIPQSRFAPGVKAILDSGDWPGPNQSGSGQFGISNNFLATGATTFFRDTMDSKVNWNVNERLSTFARFSLLDFRATNPQAYGPLGGEYLHRTNSNPGYGWGNTYSGTASATYVATPNFIIDGYFGYTVVDANVEQDRLDENLGWTVLGIPGLQSDRRFEGGWPQMQINGFSQLGITNAFMPYYRTDPQWQYVLNGNLTKGTHNIRFGTDLYLQNLAHNQPEFGGARGGAQGGFTATSGPTSLSGGPNGTDINAFGAFLLGLSNNGGKIHQFNEDGYETRTRFYSFYVRDRWQVSPKLTLSYGVRYEIFPFPTRGDRGVERYDFDNNKIWACGVGSIPTDCDISVGKHKFSPRIGLAYRMTDDFVIRAGYGITADPFNWARQLRTNYPILYVQNLEPPNSFGWGVDWRTGLPLVTEPSLGDGVLDVPNNAAVTTFDNNNAVRGYIQSWNLMLERRLGSWITSAGYVATRSINQLVNLEQNWAPINGGNAGRQLNQKFGRAVGTSLHGSLGTARYDSLQMRAERRFANGYQLGFNYTWGHALGYTNEDSGAGPRRVGLPWEYGKNYGSLNLDLRHNFQMNYIAELPFGRGKRWAQDGALNHILGGWQINGLLSRYSGRAFTITDADGTLNAPGSSQYGDCVSTPVKLGETGANSRYYDISAFARVPSTERRFGTCGSANITGPALFNTDLGIFRKFQINERVNIQFRAEIFNLTNTPHFNVPNSGVNNSNFMEANGILDTGREGIDERTVRFGLRIGF
jgi:hypothetical protein